MAEEERDTCPACGLLKVWCRDKDKGRAMFEARDEFCWPTYYMALRSEKVQSESHNATFRATQVSARFRKGHEPDLEAGLELNPADGAS